MGACASSVLPKTELDVRNVGDLRLLARTLSRRPGLARRPQNRHGETLLHLAAINGNPSAVRMLVEAGADTEAADALGRTALHTAALSAHKACLLALLESGAAVDAADSDGRTALALAAFQGHEACLRALLAAGASVAALDGGGWSPAHVAARGGHPACLQALLDAGAGTEQGDAFGRTPLAVAAAGGKEACLRALLAAGATVDARSSDGRTALHRATAAGHVGCVQLLLESGAAGAALDAGGQSALHWAAGSGQSACLAALLRDPGAAAALERADAEGRRPLHCAVLFGSLASIRCLAEAGADLSGGGGGADDDPAELAQRAGHPAAAQLLRQLRQEQAELRQAEAQQAEAEAAQGASAASSGGAGALWQRAGEQAQAAQVQRPAAVPQGPGGGRGAAGVADSAQDRIPSAAEPGADGPARTAAAADGGAAVALLNGTVVVSSREAIDPLLLFIDSQLGGSGGGRAGGGSREQAPSNGASAPTEQVQQQQQQQQRSEPNGTSALDHLRPWELRFSDLVIQRVLGQGSFGRVYLARHQETQVAVKVLTSEALTPGPQAGGHEQALSLSSPLLEDLRKEAGTMAQLRHPNCCALLGVTACPASIVTEYCSRGSLWDLLQAAQRSPAAARQLSWGRRLHLALGAATGMLHLHSRGIVHRDLKSPNLLVDAAWKAKISDFNLSKAADTAASQASTAGALNPRWLAPEVLAGGRASAASDVFSWGVVMWELLTWQVPWADVGGNPWQLAAKVVAGGRPPVPLREELPGEDTAQFEGLDAYVSLMRRCWAQDAAERPDFAEVARELRCLLQAAARGGRGAPGGGALDGE